MKKLLFSLLFFVPSVAFATLTTVPWFYDTTANLIYPYPNSLLLVSSTQMRVVSSSIGVLRDFQGNKYSTSTDRGLATSSPWAANLIPFVSSINPDKLSTNPSFTYNSSTNLLAFNTSTGSLFGENIQINQSENSSPFALVGRASANSNTDIVLLSSGGTLASPTTSSVGTALGFYMWGGYVGGTWYVPASIGATLGPTLNANNTYRSNIVFETANTAGLQYSFMRIFGDKISVGCPSTSPVSTLLVQGTPGIDNDCGGDLVTTLLQLGSNPMSGGNASGTFIGINPSTYGGDFLNFQIDGSSKLKVDFRGGVSSTNVQATGYGTFPSLNFTNATGTLTLTVGTSTGYPTSSVFYVVGTSTFNGAVNLAPVSGVTQNSGAGGEFTSDVPDAANNVAFHFDDKVSRASSTSNESTFRIVGQTGGTMMDVNQNGELSFGLGASSQSGRVLSFAVNNSTNLNYKHGIVALVTNNTGAAATGIYSGVTGMISLGNATTTFAAGLVGKIAATVDTNVASGTEIAGVASIPNSASPLTLPDAAAASIKSNWKRVSGFRASYLSRSGAITNKPLIVDSAYLPIPGIGTSAQYAIETDAPTSGTTDTPAIASAIKIAYPARGTAAANLYFDSTSALNTGALFGMVSFASSTATSTNGLWEFTDQWRKLANATGTVNGIGVFTATSTLNSYSGLTWNNASTTLTINGFLNSTGTVPTLSSCGTSPSIVGTNNWGTITEGSIATGCVMTFATPTLTNAPSCVLSSQSGLGFSYTLSNTAITITNIGALSGTKLDYHCGGLD